MVFLGHLFCKYDWGGSAQALTTPCHGSLQLVTRTWALALLGALVPPTQGWVRAEQQLLACEKLAYMSTSMLTNSNSM